MKNIIFVLSVICTACVSNFNNSDQNEEINYCESTVSVEETSSPSLDDVLKVLMKTEDIIAVE